MRTAAMFEDALIGRAVGIAWSQNSTGICRFSGQSMRTCRQCFIRVKDGIVLDAGWKQPGLMVHTLTVTFKSN